MTDSHNEVYLDRTRSRSFGTLAEQYDRYRLSYPHELFADLLAKGAWNALDIGCGRGKARPRLRRGLSVLGVEVDVRMAEVARSRGLDVDVSAFEEWDARGRTFDLVTCAQAWHWIDPVAGAVEVA